MNLCGRSLQIILVADCQLFRRKSKTASPVVLLQGSLPAKGTPTPWGQTESQDRSAWLPQGSRFYLGSIVLSCPPGTVLPCGTICLPQSCFCSSWYIPFRRQIKIQSLDRDCGCVLWVYHTSIPCLHSRTDMVSFSINASTSLFFIFCQKSFLYHLFGVYIVVFCLQNGTKMVSFWGQKNSENTLRIQSCYYISLQKSPIVASISSIGKKSRDVFTPRPNGIKSLPVTQTG